MRISDWSSDVCSSDLANSPVDAVLPTQELADLLVGTGEELLGEFAHLDSCDVVDRLLDAADDRRVAHQNTFDEVARLLRLAPDTARDPAARFGRIEIGRAACRERERQYWMISGVAVSL